MKEDFMKKTLIMFFALICIVGIASYTWADNIEVEVGYHATDYKDYPGKVGEYKANNDKDSAGINFRLLGDVQDDIFYLGINGHYYEDSDYSYWISGDFKRIFNQEFSGKHFEHWLDHDLMENLSAICGAATVSHEDFNVGKDYMIKYSEHKSGTVLNLPFLPGTQLSLNYRNQKREGHRQSQAISHCAGCHVTSRAREINEETEDLQIGITKKFNWISVAYDYFHREFDENGNTPINYYDDPRHPVKDKPFFDDRVSYGDETLTYNIVPSVKKDTHTIKTRVELPIDTTIFTSYIHSDVENKNNDLEIESDIIATRITNNSFPGLTLTGKFRYLDIDNDSVNVDINEPKSIAGKNKDYPYHNHKPTLTYNGFDPDFTRESAMSRDVITTGFDARYQLFQKTFLNLGYEWEQIDRDHYAVGKTEINTVEANLTTKPYRKVKVKVGYKWQDIDDPFANINGVCEAAAFPASTNNPWENSIQYWERQGMRTADVSNQPTRVDEATTSITWSVLQNLSLTTNYRFTDKENNQTNYSNWEQKSHMSTTSLWYALTPKLNFNLSYIYDKTKTQTLASVPVYNG